ncbi:MAG: hypothetical protein V1908_00370 [Candidatus Peregrinibacteria bacterium]
MVSIVDHPPFPFLTVITMVAERLMAMQAEKRKTDLVRKLQGVTPQHFLERSMHEVNDCLTSILAVCDSEAVHTVPKVKKYIQRVNKSLASVKSYQAAAYGKKHFNLSLALENILNVIEDNFKGKVKIVRLISDLNAMAQGDPTELEEFLLYLLVELIEDGAALETDLLVELRQKNQDALITILKDKVLFSGKVLEEIEHRAKRLTGIVQIAPQVDGIEATIRIPLVFTAPTAYVSPTVTFHDSAEKKLTMAR